ncbi:Cytochrome P450 monooxygenase [Psilocybe cubensis]|uniref:Cytochrome P450 monooxygenase n=1 Tax=Psilocybe cubensis TaxID=181762 RepID=A0ACB8GLW4_PSICU|nr:Cytochrome P450 monooxygenase [Psilocybe cubensis]KAH9476392.1 Cytochrome P450 monooxygenase [Psilocybe cubensis]
MLRMGESKNENLLATPRAYVTRLSTGWNLAWKKMWKKTQAMQCALYFKLFREVERRRRAGMIDECFAAKMLEQQEDLALERDTIVYICGVLLDGGAETTASFLQNLVLCLVKYPSVLKKAQAEVDNAVGDRLPDSNDIKSMPYVQAIIKETHRFLPTAPTSIPHASVDDSEYREYIIPRKTPILINVFGICRDPKLYERPEEFWPERYLLSPDGTMSGLPDGTGYTRTTLPFGSGKNLAVMRLLWAFDFVSIDSPAPSTPKWDIENEFVDGITLSAKPFQCKITPRSTRKASIIEKSYKSLRDSFGGQLQ